jgi:hypothetical protein
VFTEAVRSERQMEAREAFLQAEGPEGRATSAEMAAIRAEWGERPSRPWRTATKPRAAIARPRAATRRR